MTAPVRLVIAGLGLIGRRHAEAIAIARNADLVGVVDPGDAGRAYAQDRDLLWFETLTGMFSALEPDGVILAAPNAMHVDQGQECVDSQTPVLIEKPLATSVAEGLDLVRAAETAKVPVLVGHHRRHNPLIRKAYEQIASGAIGEVRSVHSTCWLYKPDGYFEEAPWRKQKGAGPISVNLVHDVDLIRYLCGEVVSVHAMAAPAKRGYDNEDVAVAVLRFASGAIGSISVSDAIVSPWSWELTARENPAYPATDQSCYMIGGSRGALSVPDLSLWNNQEEPSWCNPLSATTVPRDFSDPLVNQIEHFAAVVRGMEQPLVTGLEGLRSLQVVEAIQTSAATGDTVELADIAAAA